MTEEYYKELGEMAFKKDLVGLKEKMVFGKKEYGKKENFYDFYLLSFQ